MTILKNSNCDPTPIVTKLKLWQNSNCDKKQIVTNSNCDKSQIVTTLQLWQNSNWGRKNSKTQYVTQLTLWQNLKYDKCQFKKKLNLKGSFSKNILTPWQLSRCSLGSVLRFPHCFFTAMFWAKIFTPQKTCLSPSKMPHLLNNHR